MARKNQHVVPLGNGWAVKGEGNKKFTVITETQKDAITVARGIAKNNGSELIIYGKDGKIRYKDSYVNNANPPKGQKTLIDRKPATNIIAIMPADEQSKTSGKDLVSRQILSKPPRPAPPGTTGKRRRQQATVT